MAERNAQMKHPNEMLPGMLARLLEMKHKFNFSQVSTRSKECFRKHGSKKEAMIRSRYTTPGRVQTLFRAQCFLGAFRPPDSLD